MPNGPLRSSSTIGTPLCLKSLWRAVAFEVSHQMIIPWPGFCIFRFSDDCLMANPHGLVVKACALGRFSDDSFKPTCSLEDLYHAYRLVTSKVMKSGPKMSVMLLLLVVGYMSRSNVKDEPREGLARRVRQHA